jgi:enoyl-CoA hydratase
MTDNKDIEVSHDGPVTIIRINRSQVRNAINKSIAQALKDAWLAFESDEKTLVGILTGGDEVFCAGADLNDVDELATFIEGDSGPLGFTRLFINKPTIAAVAGYCVAGGLEIACWCDLRIADESAVFGCFERRFGVPLIDGGTQRLPRIIGLGRALEMILTGRPVSAKEALAIGLVNEVVPPGHSLKRAVELAKILAKFPQICVHNDRQAVYAGIGKELTEGLRTEARLGAQTIKSGEPLRGSYEFKSGKGRKGKF